MFSFSERYLFKVCANRKVLEYGVIDNMNYMQTSLFLSKNFKSEANPQSPVPPALDPNIKWLQTKFAKLKSVKINFKKVNFARKKNPESFYHKPNWSIPMQWVMQQTLIRSLSPPLCLPVQHNCSRCIRLRWISCRRRDWTQL